MACQLQDMVVGQRSRFNLDMCLRIFQELHKRNHNKMTVQLVTLQDYVGGQGQTYRVLGQFGKIAYWLDQDVM